MQLIHTFLMKQLQWISLTILTLRMIYKGYRLAKQKHYKLEMIKISLGIF